MDGLPESPAGQNEAMLIWNVEELSLSWGSRHTPWSTISSSKVKTAKILEEVEIDVDKFHNKADREVHDYHFRRAFITWDNKRLLSL